MSGYFNAQISTVFPSNLGTASRMRFVSTPMSAGAETPVMSFRSPVPSTTLTVESVSL